MRSERATWMDWQSSRGGKSSWKAGGMGSARMGVALGAVLQGRGWRMAGVSSR